MTTTITTILDGVARVALQHECVKMTSVFQDLFSVSVFQPPAIIDVEASGFGSASYPIEVGFVLPDGASYCALIQPAPGWSHWDESAEQVHLVSRETLQEHGHPAAEVARQLNNRLQGQTIYCDAWYHDFTWLSRLFHAAGCDQTFRLEDIRTLLNEAQAEHWHLTKLQIQAELGLPRHRASNDAKILQATLARVRTLYGAHARAGA
jgi:hypothetical protein